MDLLLSSRYINLRPRSLHSPTPTRVPERERSEASLTTGSQAERSAGRLRVHLGDKVGPTSVTRWGRGPPR